MSASHIHNPPRSALLLSSILLSLPLSISLSAANDLCSVSSYSAVCMFSSGSIIDTVHRAIARPCTQCPWYRYTGSARVATMSSSSCRYFDLWYGKHHCFCMEQRREGKVRVDSFIKSHKGKEVLVFTDVSVAEGFIGIGGCAAVLLPISPEENEKIANVVCSGLTDNLEAEVCGIALGMDMAIQYYNTQPPRTEHDNLYIRDAPIIGR